MVVIDEIVVATGTQYDGNHMFAKKSRGFFTSLLTPVTATLLHFSEPHGNLGRPKVGNQHGPDRGVQLGIHLTSHWWRRV